ncbi:MAG: hypothetical protein V2I34_01465 [Bacteroidales bacterium]|jgi:hypothetical protein|nr:hypothetical protein [Bacteroidales bacterium]
MKRIAVLIVILVLTAILLIIGRRFPFGAGNSDFHVDNTEKISRILISGEKQSADLQRSPGGWIVNGRHPVRPSAIEPLLQFIEQLRIKSPVSGSVFEEIRSDENTSLVEVQIFAGRRIIQSYRIYRDSAPVYGGIMQKRRDTKPFYVHVPGYDIDPSSYFIADEKYWMPYTVFSISPEEIEGIDMHYFSKEDSSFSIVIDDRDILFSSAAYGGGDLDTAAIGRYLSYFTYVPFERWVPDSFYAAGSPVSELQPYFRLDLRGRDNDTLSLLTWTMMINEGGRTTEDTDRLMGSTNGGDDMFIIKYYDLDPVIKGPSYFISD